MPPTHSPNSTTGVCIETSFPYQPSHRVVQQNGYSNNNEPPVELSSSIGSSLRGSQISSIYHSLDNESVLGKTSISMPTSEATTVQLNRTFINYNDTLSQSNPPSYCNVSSNNAGRKPNNLSLQTTRLKKIYSVVGENILGMAPLASPESLSEMSSVSSLQNGNGDYTPEDKHLLSEFESQMHTPKILRRAPKINAPLSNIDWKTVEEYEKLGQVFFTNQVKVPSNDNLNSSDIMIDEIFDYTNFNKRQFEMYRKHESSKSDNSLDESNQFRSKSTNFRMSDSAIDHNTTGNEIVGCGTITLSSSGTYASANSSLSGLQIQNNSNSKLMQKMNIFEEEEYFMSRVTPEGVIESHFPVYHDLNDGSEYKANNRGKNNNNCYDANSNSSSTIGNESLPLLTNLNERSVTVTSAANFVKRKKYVYPIGGNPVVHGSPSYKVTSSNASPRSSKSSQSLNKNESSV